MLRLVLSQEFNLRRWGRRYVIVGNDIRKILEVESNANTSDI